MEFFLQRELYHPEVQLKTKKKKMDENVNPLPSSARFSSPAIATQPRISSYSLEYHRGRSATGSGKTWNNGYLKNRSKHSIVYLRQRERP